MQCRVVVVLLFCVLLALCPCLAYCCEHPEVTVAVLITTKSHRASLVVFVLTDSSARLTSRQGTIDSPNRLPKSRLFQSLAPAPHTELAGVTPVLVSVSSIALSTSRGETCALHAKCHVVQGSDSAVPREALRRRSGSGNSVNTHTAWHSLQATAPG